MLGLLHGLVFGARPDIETAGQIALTFAALPVAFFVGWVFTKIVEEPITAYGRTWRWSRARRGAAIAAVATPGAS